MKQKQSADRFTSTAQKAGRDLAWQTAPNDSYCGTQRRVKELGLELFLGAFVRPSYSSGGGVSRTNWLICLNSGDPARWHHSNKAASVVVSVTPEESIRLRAV